MTANVGTVQVRFRKFLAPAAAEMIRGFSRTVDSGWLQKFWPTLVTMKRPTYTGTFPLNFVDRYSPPLTASNPEFHSLFSYGIICWELLTRQCPYDGMDAIQCALSVLNRNRRPEIPKWCPPSLHALIRACLKKNPDERPTFLQITQAFDSMP